MSMDDLIFLEDGVFEGKPCKLPVAPYLLFLHLSQPNTADAVKRLRAALVRHPADIVERDICRVFSHHEWRLHLLACMAMADGFHTEPAMDALWDRLRQRSWASPQLAATATYLDKSFIDKAKAVIADPATEAKSVMALAALLQSEHAITIEDTPLAQAVRDAKTRDSDDAGRLALKWLAGLRRTLTAMQA
jgi:hypothetical protein